MSIETEGIDDLEGILRGAREKLYQDLPGVMQDGGNIVVLDGRSNHRFTSRTNRLENSLEAVVDPQSLTLSIHLDDRFTTLENGESYGDYIHNGTAYMAPDPFVEEANERHEKYILDQITEAIWHSLTRPV